MAPRFTSTSRACSPRQAKRASRAARHSAASSASPLVSSLLLSVFLSGRAGACTTQEGPKAENSTNTSSFSTQVLEEKPGEAIDLLDTSLLVKKTAFHAQESAPLVPISVRARVVCTRTLLSMQSRQRSHC